MAVDLGTIPNGAPLYVAELYTDLLQRAPTQPDLNYWVTILRNGGSTYDVAHRVITSTEHLAVQVQQYYFTYFGHAADPAGLAFQVNLLQLGVSPLQVQRGLIDSPEFQAAHVTNQSYVDALYTDVLGRPADPAGETFWLTALGNGASRDSVAAAFLNSREYFAKVIQADFNLVLNRSAEPGAVQFWTQNLIQHRGNDGPLLAALFNSDENLDKL
jgi:hypothetical protein